MSAAPSSLALAVSVLAQSGGQHYWASIHAPAILAGYSAASLASAPDVLSSELTSLVTQCCDCTTAKLTALSDHICTCTACRWSRSSTDTVLLAHDPATLVSVEALQVAVHIWHCQHLHTIAHIVS